MAPKKGKWDTMWENQVRFWLASKQDHQALLHAMKLFTSCTECQLHFKDAAKPECTKQKCKDNPHCLQHIIPTYDLMESIDCQIVGSQMKGMVGIKNAGAICYLISLLQIWFRIPEFRSGIYRYQSQDQYDIANTIKKIFGFLQYSNRKYIEITELTEMLGLAVMVQQDALEISKLLGAYLESLFKNNNQLGSTRLVVDSFKGEMVYATTCQKCKNETFKSEVFSDLCINLGSENRITLTNSLNNLLSGELLTGGNKYFCRNCDSKEEAVRLLQLKKLPQNLNIVINRFVYDSQAMVRRKVNKILEFPKEFDMGRFSQPGNSAIYDLKAALLHNGPNTNCGHYISRVFDSSKGAWVSCDDETVTKLENPTFDLESIDAIDLTDDEPAQKSKKSKISTYESKSVYLLVYKRREDVEEIEASLSAEILTSIEKNNLDYEVFVAAERKDRENRLNETQEKKTFYAELKESVNESQNSESLTWILSTDALSEAMDLDFNQMNTTNENELLLPLKPLTIDNTLIKCEHELFNPHSILNVKKFSGPSYSILKDKLKFNIIYEFTCDDLCVICFEDKLKASIATYQHHTDLANYIGITSGGPHYWISKKWFNEWRKKSPKFDNGIPSPMAQEFKLDVFCEHGNLSADEPTRKAIPKQVRFTKKGMEILKARFPELETIEEGQDPCSVCIVANFTRAELEKVTKSELQMENAILGRLTRITRLEAVVDDRFFAIPTIFVEKIRAAILDPQENCRPTVIDTRVLMCNNHQMLKYSPEYDNIKNAHYWAAVESDWEYLNRNYERIGPEIVLESRNIDDTIIMYPVLGWCEACRIEMISNYSSGTVLVVQRPLDDGKGMPSKPDKKRSARKVSRKSASRLEVEIAPTMTLRELMYKLVPKFKAHPLYQKIYKNKIELDTMDATLKELTIYPGDRLEVEIYAQDSQDFADEEPFHSVEAGFKGTFLHDVA